LKRAQGRVGDIVVTSPSTFVDGSI